MAKQKISNSESKIRTTEEVAESEKQKAIDNGYPDPYFDFREFYVKGDTLYYAYINDLMGTKELVELTVRTVYARTLMGYEDNAGCHVIGYESKDKLFANKKEGSIYLKSIKVEPKYK